MSERTYSNGQPTRMSAIGKRIWLYMQENDPLYNRRSLAQKWTRDGTFPISAQSISNYLYRENPPPDFVNAIVKEFNLTPEQEWELHWLYFHPEGRVSA